MPKLPQDLVKNIVGKILERAEEIRKSLTSEVETEPKSKLGRKTKKAVKAIKNVSKKTSKKVIEKAKKMKAKKTNKTTKKRV